MDIYVSLAEAVFKSVLGFMTGSMALHAHGLHSLADFLTKSITLVSVKISSWAPTEKFPYGYGKVQFLSSAFIGASLLIGSSVFLYENIRHINEGLVEAPEIWALAGALLAAGASELMHRYLGCVAEHNNSPAIRAAAWDNRVDALSSLAVVAGVLLSNLGWPVADHLAAVLVSLMVIKIGAQIIIDSVTGLMDVSVPEDVLNRIRRIADRTEGVIDIAHLRGRKLGERLEIDMSVVIEGAMPTRESHAISRRIEHAIRTTIAHIGEVNVVIVPADVGR